MLRRDGPRLEIATPAYRLTIEDRVPLAHLVDASGEPWADLALLSSVHATPGLDETAALGPAVVVRDGSPWGVTIEARSSRWRRKVLVLEGDDDAIRLAWQIEGDGRLTDLHLLGGFFSGLEGRPTGFVQSGAAFDTLFSPEPGHPGRLTAPAAEPASIDVLGGFYPGRGHWFFTPAPFCFALSRSGRSPWLGVSLEGRMEDAGFTSFHFVPGERAFSFRLDYEAQTAIDGAFETPPIVLRLGAADPYEALARHAEAMRATGLAPTLPPSPASPAWWLEPMFCGWGAQAYLARSGGGVPAAYATQARYDAFLGALERRGLRPGTVVIDDGWQAAYGTNKVDTSRWPDLRGWIGHRHEGGQRVLLWLKAWDPEGLPADLCVRNTLGRPVAADPSNPKYEERLRAGLWRMLGPDGYDADGLKVDFTARTPSGPGLSRHGREWGVSLLHRLLATIHEEAHRVKPDALVITHAPNPGFASVTDMLRLNDMIRLDEPDPVEPVVDQMLHRARIAAAASPGVPIDTDDWSAPDLATWRRWQRAKAGIGVPALYYATHLDRTGEALEAADYELLKETWAEARAQAGLS